MSTNSRGAAWFTALTGIAAADAVFRGPHGAVGSVLVADTEIDGRPARVLATRPDPANRWPRARHGELGLDEGWAIAAAVRLAVTADAGAQVRRTIVAIVDSPSQAYGHREETLAVYQALAAAVDAYSAARLAGHPVVALVVGNGISGAFLAHGLQANRILVLDDPRVTIQAMSRESTARITRRSVADLDAVAAKVPATAYDGATFATLGAVHATMPVSHADDPDTADAATARRAIADAATDALRGEPHLSTRLTSAAAARQRAASIEVRRRLAASWDG